jgi:hypothetical protein
MGLDPSNQAADVRGVDGRVFSRNIATQSGRGLRGGMTHLRANWPSRRKPPCHGSA